MKNILSFLSFMIMTFNGFTQKTAISPEGVKLVLVSVENLMDSTSPATYARICAAAHKKGYLPWPNDVIASDVGWNARGLMEFSESAVVATERPIGDSQHQQFLYSVSKTFSYDYGATYKESPVTLVAFDGKNPFAVFPSTALFIFKLE